MTNVLRLVFLIGVLSSCVVRTDTAIEVPTPSDWNVQSATKVPLVEAEQLQNWWHKFEDPVLNMLVEQALESSPDRLIAEAKIEEARGLRRSHAAYLFPQINLSGAAGREDPATEFAAYPDSFYDAGFDAAFEIDLFGKNRKNYVASDSALKASRAYYHDVSITLIAEVVRTYIDYKAAQRQVFIANKNLTSQAKNLDLVRDLNQRGEVPKLDVERAENLVSVTRASLPEYSRQSDNARLRLSVLIGQIPENIAAMLSQDSEIPGGDVRPVLMAPAQVIALRPDVQSAAENLAASTARAESISAEIFPTFSIGGFYGIADSALIHSASPWNIALGAAVSLLDFGRIEGRIDTANAKQKQAFEQYRKTVLVAISDVETALTDYAHIRQQQLSLKKAYQSAANAVVLSEILYKEGEASFLDVLDAQRSANAAESAMVAADAAQSESLTRLFKSLGVY